MQIIDINNLRKEILELKSNLNKLNSEKEIWFSKKEDLKKEVHLLIGELKKLKQSKDSSVNAFQAVKKERDFYNQQVKSLIAKIKVLNNERTELFKKYKIKVDPRIITERISLLEKKIETEALPFEKEQEMMKKIKIFKKQFGETQEIKKAYERIDSVSKEIEIARNKANDLHKSMQALKVSKDDYKGFIELSRKISLLKKEQEEAFMRFISLKKDFAQINSQLKNKLSQLEFIKKEQKDKFMKKLQEKKEKERKELEIKSNTVEDKIKNKKKLTRDDLLVFQKMSN